MNWQHFRAFFWLHWRLRVNQIRRGGIANKVILAILAVHLVLAAIALFVGSFLVAFLFDKAPAWAFLLAWDVAVVAFLTWWGIGLLTELQRSEALALTKFLHLPVSLWGVFLLNYLTSLVSVNLILFAPAMVGFSLGLTFAIGPVMLLLLPSVAAFLLMVTGVSYQFQGWLASLMVDKRRRRTIIFLVTVVFVLLCQLPNLVNMLRPWELAGGQGWTKEQEQQSWAQVEQTAWFVNLALPPGWLPLGAMELTKGNVIPALLGTVGMALIGSASLWRAYRTTVRLYTGHYTAGARPTAVVAPVSSAETVKPPDGMIALRLPGLSESASAIALASFRSLTRAPEARMLLLSPILMMVIFGGLFFRNSLDMPSLDMPHLARPLPAFGAMAMMFFTLIQLVGNQFGFDRSGFRVFVLSPAPRREVLLGKNLSVLPIAILLASPVVILIQVAFPMRLDYFVALAFQFLSMYLLFCLLANLLSIYAPIPVAAASLKPAKTGFVPLVLHFVFAFFFMVVQAFLLLPLGVEFVLETLEWRQGMPVCLLLSLVECAAIACLYRWALRWQGDLLQGREQRILEVVAMKAE